MPPRFGCLQQTTSDGMQLRCPSTQRAVIAPGAGAPPARPKPWSRTASSPVQCPSDRGSRSFQSCLRAGDRMACRPCERKQSRVIDEVIEDTKPAARMKPTVPNRDKALRINADPRTARPPLVRKQGGAGGTAGPAASAAHAGCRLGWIKSLGRIQPGIDLRRFPGLAGSHMAAAGP